MSSAWAEEAEHQAKALTRDLIEVGRAKGFRVTYQRREARFLLRGGSATAYFDAHAYDTPKGMDWLQLRIDVLTRVRRGMQLERLREAADRAAAEDEAGAPPSPS